jgi:hypothetical protein
MEDGMVMQLYWDCQELRTQLETATASADREKLIQQSIKVILVISGICWAAVLQIRDVYPGSNQKKRRG